MDNVFADDPWQQNLRQPSKLDHIITTLREMAHLLEVNNHCGQAAYVAALATIGEWDQDVMIPGLRSGAMWGGSGSVWEVGEFQSIDVTHLYWNLLVRLVAEMQSAGIKTESAESVTLILKKWLSMGL